MCKILREIQNLSPEQLLQKYNVSSEPPVDLSELLRKIGMSAIATDFSEAEKIGKYEKDSMLGATISNGEDVAIFYRDKDTKNRQTFTIAHELAHCCLHTSDLKTNHIEFRRKETPTFGKEYESNIFAGKLLIPTKEIKEIYNQLLMPSLSVLSNIFQVSTNVMAARLDYLELPYFKDIELSES